MKLSAITHRFISVVFLVAPGGGNALASTLFVSVLLLCHLSVNAQKKAREAASTTRIDKPVTTRVRRPELLAIAAVRPARMRESFSVGYVFGDRDVFNVKIERPGPLEVRAAWQGSAPSLALILNGPGKTVARQDGASPLRISFEITPQLLKLGNEWTISIVNFSSRGSASGVILIDYPVPARKFIDLAPDQRSAIVNVIGKKPASGKTEQRILPDGRIETLYPDGKIVLDSSVGCGGTIIYPNGKIEQFQCMLSSQVQPGNPPSLPSDDPLFPWLNSYNDNLLATIQTILQNDQTSVNYYLKNVESGKPLLEVIRLRIKFIGKLAGALATEP